MCADSFTCLILQNYNLLSWINSTRSDDFPFPSIHDQSHLISMSLVKLENFLMFLYFYFQEVWLGLPLLCLDTTAWSEITVLVHISFWGRCSLGEILIGFWKLSWCSMNYRFWIFSNVFLIYSKQIFVVQNCVVSACIMFRIVVTLKSHSNAVVMCLDIHLWF